MQIIKHDPLWANDLARLASKPYENMTQGHVYADTRRVVGTFLRIDIPILAELTQYDYLLFTDVGEVLLVVVNLSTSFPLYSSIWLSPVTSIGNVNRSIDIAQHKIRTLVA